jgi:3-phosphoshikimate 1-carboxyvinyltransferase
MNYTISRQNKPLLGELKVPSSKSISNRLLIIRAVSEKYFEIDNLSESEDTKVLAKALSENSKIIDIGHAGTSMRFLTAYFASTAGEKVLTGSKRMKERPIGNLVEALNKIGADISYLEKEGFPPLQIKGKQLDGGRVAINSSISSQFISALLLSAPTFKNGLELKLENKIISSSYIDLTIKLMEQMGVKIEKLDNCLKVSPQKYTPYNIKVEGDWSGVSYWYEAAAFSSGSDIYFHDLKKESLQGDSRCADIFKYFGVETEYLPDGIRIHNI